MVLLYEKKNHTTSSHFNWYRLCLHSLEWWVCTDIMCQCAATIFHSVSTITIYTLYCILYIYKYLPRAYLKLHIPYFVAVSYMYTFNIHFLYSICKIVPTENVSHIKVKNFNRFRFNGLCEKEEKENAHSILKKFSLSRIMFTLFCC